MLLDIILPVFGLVLFGFFSARSGLFKQAHVAGLASFCFTFAVPVLLFNNMASAQFSPQIEWPLLLSFYGGGLSCWLLAMAAGRWLFGLPLRGQAIMGFVGAFSNSALLGIPLVLASVGPEGTVPMVMLLMIHAAVYFSLFSVVTAVAEGHGESLPRQLRRLGGDLVTNPILLGLAAGMLVNLLGIPLPGVVHTMVDRMASAALPASAFAMGASLARYRIAGNLTQAGLLVGIKLAVHPTLVFVLGKLVFGLSGVWLSTAVLMAAMPTGINAYVLAERNDVCVPVAATAILAGTALSVASVSVVLLVLGIA
jgi:malonate transporter and related proteins